MTTVKQLIKYLEQFPEDTEVNVLQEYSGSYYTSTRWVALDLDEYSENINYYPSLKLLELGDD